MSFNAVVDTIADLWETDSTTPIYVEGPPGCGKTSMAFTLAERLGIDPRVSHQGGGVVVFRPSLRDPVDLMGTPNNDGDTTRWKPPHELAQLREGKWLLVIDELPQGGPQMQNALAGLMLDRFINELHLSDDVYIMATGNRTQDKAGANRVVSQLGNRVCRLVMDDPNIDEFTTWALDKDLDPVGIAFLRRNVAALLDFDADRFSNATPRSWERVLRLNNEKMPGDRFFKAVTGFVGEGRAAEYIGFRRMADSLPDVDAIVKDPDNTPVPDSAEVCYVCVSTLSTMTKADNFATLLRYVKRLRGDHHVMYVRNAVACCPQVMDTKEFGQWAIDHHDAFMG